MPEFVCEDEEKLHELIESFYHMEKSQIVDRPFQKQYVRKKLRGIFLKGEYFQ